MTERARSVKVRPLEWRDYPDLAENYLLAYGERDRGEPIWLHLFGSAPPPSDEVAWFAWLFRAVLAGDAVCRVAEVDGRAVGLVSVLRVGRDRDAENGHVGELGILVHPEHRDRGVGSALFASVIEACRGTFDLVRLSVFSENARGIALYRKFGFVPYGHVPAHVRRAGKYYDAELMILDLRAPSPKG